MLDIRLVKMQNTSSNLTTGSVITYTIEIQNIGDITINNVVLLDNIPSGTTFVTGSVTLNGVSLPAANPNPPSGVFIGTMSIGTTSTLTFNVLVNNLPFTPFTIVNCANLIYNYTLDPNNPNGAFGSTDSNCVSAIIDNNRHCFGSDISVDKYYVLPGDILTYTITISNLCPGIDTIYITDDISPCLSFTDNVIIDGIKIPEASPIYPNSIPVDVSISPPVNQRVRTVTYQVTPNTCPCIATSTIHLVDNNGIEWDNKTLVTTIDCRTIPCLSVNKKVDKNPAVIGDTLTYTTTIKNNCTASADNVYLTDDMLPCLSFTDNVTINNIKMPGANPIRPSSIPIGNIAAGATTTVTYQATPNTCPCTARNTAYALYQNVSIPSNTVVTTISCATVPITTIPLKINKETCKCISCLGEKIPYTIKVTNTSSLDINNIVVEDIIPLGSYIYSTIVSDGNISELNGKLTWTIPNLQPGSNTMAMVIMIATEKICFDNRRYIINTAKIVSYNGKPTTNTISDTTITYIDCFCCDYKK